MTKLNDDNQGVTPEHLRNLGNIPSAGQTVGGELRKTMMSILGANQLERRNGYKPGSKKAIQLEIIMALVATHTAKAVEAARQHGMRVGRYQAADKLYGDVIHIYMFGDKKAAKSRRIAEWSATALLKDCEAFMNDNRRAYTEYLLTLKGKPRANSADVPPTQAIQVEPCGCQTKICKMHREGA